MAQPYFVLQEREYPMPDFSTITFAEARLVKKATGLRMGELPEAFEAGDVDAVLSLFLIAKMRVDGAIKIDDVEKLPVAELRVVQPEDDEAAPLENAEVKAGSETENES